MNITVLCVGKIKETYFSEAILEYKKRLGRYASLEIIEAPDEKAPERLSEAEELKVKEKEGLRLKKYIRDDAYVIALAIEGKQPDSIALSKKLDMLMVDGISRIIFIIGGSLGLHPDILKRADEQLSFSKMTFPHQLMRVILLEQLYRCFRISKGEPYHK